MTKRGTTEAKPEDSATAWFAVLESAKLSNDFERAAEAVRQLRRLGVVVRFVVAKATEAARSSSPARTVPEVAKQLRVAPGKVRTWIDSGELVAANVATSTASRPVYRISPDDLAAFLAGRAPTPKTSAKPDRAPRHSQYREYI